jgi:methylated-DNA-[protein]-cysteine S-methyltransferase
VRRNNAGVPEESSDSELLRGRGLRSTPQRRAILAAFEGGGTEHLSADEVHARASQAMPDLGRGTVYATLAEFTELGLLAAFGAPEPVRYEVNTESHDHFRCRLCLRLFDLDLGGDTRPRTKDGFRIERVERRAEGVCAECADYDRGLVAGARAIRATGSDDAALDQRGAAARELSGPLGRLLLAASPRGVARLAFEEDGDAERLRALASSRRGAAASRDHLDQAGERLREYLSGAKTEIECAIDWDALTPGQRAALPSAKEIPYGTRRSYADLGVELPPHSLGGIFGANPIPLLIPCHRVLRGVEVPDTFVGGPERRRWLLAHEQRHSASA